MEEATELANYLPLSFKTLAEQEYIAFLWDAFESNYTHGKYQFAFLAYHMLTMSFVYFKIWQIKHAMPGDFAKALIGFTKEIEGKLTEAKSPFDFSRVNESTVLRFLKLIECDNAKIGTYAKLVQDRNDTAHPNGNILYSQQNSIDGKIREILRVVAEIQRHSRCVIEGCYREFLRASYDPEVREYPADEDQIHEELVHRNYLSTRDIQICAATDLTLLSDEEHAGEMEGLHMWLRMQYGDILEENTVA
jgi:hypothetical protein